MVEVNPREFQEVKTTLERHLVTCSDANNSNKEEHVEMRVMIGGLSNRLWLLLATTLIGTIAILGTVLTRP